ncbi:error-prone DNA polymerase [Kitasatospora sp. NPDC001574]
MGTPGERDAVRAVARWAGHPGTLGAVLVLIVNDHVGKRIWPDTLLTGKASDLAWMLAAPPVTGLLVTLVLTPLATLLATLLPVRAPLRLCGDRPAVIGLLVTAVSFGFAKSGPPGGEIASGIWSWSGLPSRIEGDPADLAALPLLGLSWWLWTRARAPRRRRPWSAVVGVPLAVAAMVATSPTQDRTPFLRGDRGRPVLEVGSDLWTTGDGGSTWTLLKGEPPARPGDRARRPDTGSCLPGDPLHCFRLLDSTSPIEVSTDGGRHWGLANDPGPSVRRSLPPPRPSVLVQALPGLPAAATPWGPLPSESSESLMPEVPVPDPPTADPPMPEQTVDVDPTDAQPPVQPTARADCPAQIVVVTVHGGWAVLANYPGQTLIRGDQDNRWESLAYPVRPPVVHVEGPRSWGLGIPVAVTAGCAAALAALAARLGLTTVASTNAHHAGPAQGRLAQSLAALHDRRTLPEAAGWTQAAGTAHLRSGREMAARLARFPGVREATVDLARACAFDFAKLDPELPGYPVPSGHTEISHLRALVAEGGPARFGPGNGPARRQLARELDVIEDLDLAGYFLIVHDIVDFCRREGIWCQGRGSAANSAVCFALGITAVDPVHYRLLFERFLSTARDGPPDIDLDIENRRREEVIQYVYRRYGREHAAQVANVVTYRPRLALRDAARVLGYPQGQVDAFSRQADFRSPPGADAVVPADVLSLAGQLHGLPRHLGIHSGGMVLTREPIAEICPTEWARMPGRSVLQWDKESVAGAGLVKIDLLGLGMLAALHDACDLVEQHHGRRYDLATVPDDDPGVYAMLRRADTVGVFQVESRAQMATLPRLKPDHFYDLVVEVALIRPGPIQGGSVHPYLRRRAGVEPAGCPHPLMENALGKTLGVPLFQEQMMQLAIDCAGFTPAEADLLRQAMGAKRSHERVARLRERLLGGMAERGIPEEVAEDVYTKIEAFSNYGFPESHAISFAYLVYASAWLKYHYPAAFTCALLANQPMGFYSSLSLIADVRRHGVRVRGVDVNASGSRPTLEPYRGPTPAPPLTAGTPQPAIRLGLDTVRGIGAAQAEAVAAGQPYTDLEDFARRTGLPAPAMEALASAGAFGCFGLNRRQALWAAGAFAGVSADLIPGTTPGTEAPPLPGMTPIEETIADLWATGTSATSHPLQHLRDHLERGGALTAAQLPDVVPGSAVVVGGLVTHRQRPPTAGGVLFLSLEDETGLINVICSRPVWESQRRAALDRAGLLVYGHVERDRGATNLVATRLTPLRIGI